MNKTFLSALILTLLVSSAAVQAAELGKPTTVLTCTPSEADSNRSGLETVVVTKHVWGCSQIGAGPHCFAMGIYYTAEVTVNVPFDNFVSQTYRIGFPGEVVPGRGAQYTGEGFELDMGPVVAHPIAHLKAHLKAKDGYPAQEVSANVDCR